MMSITLPYPFRARNVACGDNDLVGVNIAFQYDTTTMVKFWLRKLPLRNFNFCTYIYSQFQIDRVQHEPYLVANSSGLGLAIVEEGKRWILFVNYERVVLGNL